MNDKNKVIEDSVAQSLNDLNKIDSLENINSDNDELIVQKHSPIITSNFSSNSSKIKSPKINLDYRIPSPPAVVKTEYIVKEYKGIPKKEESTCLIEKRISFKEETISIKPDKKNEELKSNRHNRETTFVNNGLLIGGGIVGALIGAYVLSKGNSE